MAVIRSADHPDLFDVSLSRVFTLPYEASPEYSRWIDVETTNRQWEESLKTTLFGNVPEKTEGGLISFENIQSSSTKRITPLEWGLGYIITRRARDDEKHGVFVGLTQGLRASFRNLYEVRCARILNNATSTDAEHLGLDGKSLLNSAHPLEGGAGTQSNSAGTVDLSQAYVEDAIVNFYGLKTEKGLNAKIIPELCISNYTNQFEMAKIFRNVMEPDSANRNTNYLRTGPAGNGVTDYIASVFFTDTNGWLLMSGKGKRPGDAVLKVRVSPEFKVGSDFRSDNYMARGYCRIEAGYHNYYHFYGSMGSS